MAVQLVTSCRLRMWGLFSVTKFRDITNAFFSVAHGKVKEVAVFPLVRDTHGRHFVFDIVIAPQIFRHNCDAPRISCVVLVDNVQ